MEKPKLGGDELTASFRRRLEETIQQKFNGFKAENEQKYKDYIVSSDHKFVENRWTQKLISIQGVAELHRNNSGAGPELHGQRKSHTYNLK